MRVLNRTPLESVIAQLQADAGFIRETCTAKSPQYPPIDSGEGYRTSPGNGYGNGYGYDLSGTGELLFGNPRPPRSKIGPW